MEGRPCDHSDTRYRHGVKSDFGPADVEQLEAIRFKRQQAAGGVEPAAAPAEPTAKAKPAPKKKGKKGQNALGAGDEVDG